ncbi:MAG: TPM domain-containing protein, partial [Thermoanaerobaculales bacterium]
MRAGIVALLMSVGVLSPVAALEVPPVPTSYLTDLAGAIPPAQGADIERRLQALETSSGHQVIAVLFPTLAGEALEDFTIRCAERWKVGGKRIDDGAIFFAFIRDRRMRLEVGYGLEAK